MLGFYVIPDSYPRFASGLIFLASAIAIFWIVFRIGKDLPPRNHFRLIGSLFFLCALAQFVRVLPSVQALPGFVAATRLFLFICLLLLSGLVLFSTPFLGFVLHESAELIRRRDQERFSALVRAAPMAVVATDCQGHITSWNPGAERIFGWSAEEIIGTRGKTVPPDRLPEQIALLERALKGAVTTGFETERWHRDGRRFPVNISNAPLYDERGKLIGSMAVVEDISERKRIERELAEKSATLTAVTDALNCFLESGDYGAASRHLLSRALQRTQSEYGFRSDVQLTFHHNAAHSWILADASQLEQVLANLAINARDAMPGGRSLIICTRNALTLLSWRGPPCP